jgi:hypothetical protein
MKRAASEIERHIFKLQHLAPLRHAGNTQNPALVTCWTDAKPQIAVYARVDPTETAVAKPTLITR